MRCYRAFSKCDAILFVVSRPYIEIHRISFQGLEHLHLAIFLMLSVFLSFYSCLKAYIYKFFDIKKLIGWVGLPQEDLQVPTFENHYLLKGTGLQD
jgi:hypothetical protein